MNCVLNAGILIQGSNKSFSHLKWEAWVLRHLIGYFFPKTSSDWPRERGIQEVSTSGVLFPPSKYIFHGIMNFGRSGSEQATVFEADPRSLLCRRGKVVGSLRLVWAITGQNTLGPKTSWCSLSPGSTPTTKCLLWECSSSRYSEQLNMVLILSPSPSFLDPLYVALTGLELTM